MTKIERPMKEKMKKFIMRLEGLINRTQVVIMIDSGSTHNFLNPNLLKPIPLTSISTINLPSVGDN
jgi:hypothetical protein